MRRKFISREYLFFFYFVDHRKIIIAPSSHSECVCDGNNTNVCGPSKNHSNTLSVQNDQLFSEEYITFSLPINSIDIRSWFVVQNIKYCYITLNGLLSWKTFVRNECYFRTNRVEIKMSGITYNRYKCWIIYLICEKCTQLQLLVLYIVLVFDHTTE